MAKRSSKNRRSKAKKATARRARPSKPRIRARRKAGGARKAAKTRKPAASRRSAKASRRATTRRAAGRRPRAKAKARPKTRKTTRPTAPVVKAGANRPRTTERPSLDRTRRVLPDVERLDLDTAATRQSAGQDRMMLAAKSGRDELRHQLDEHTESSPSLTAGDIDARWQDAYAVGDEAPGGDNPTPDQDRVDEIGKAMGIEYQDDQELMGGEELTERDKHRWELDPASSEDWPHDKK